MKIDRKWNRLCISYDFVKNEGQLGFSGYVSDLVKDPNTDLNMKGENEKLSTPQP